MSKAIAKDTATTARVLYGAAALDELHSRWQALEAAGGCPTPFQSARWVRAWQKHFAHGEPVIVSLDDAAGRPVALLPLQRERVLGFLRLTWLSVPGLQYGGVLLRPMPAAERQAAFTALWEAVLQVRGDYIDLPLLQKDDPFCRFLAAECIRGPENASFRIDFSGFEDWRAYELALKPSARRSRKKRLNKLKRAGELDFRVHAAGPELRSALARALEWKRGWLSAQGLSGALPFQPAFESLLNELFATETRNEPLVDWRVAVLSLNGRPIAVDAGKVCGSAFYSWFSAYDADFAEHSPGKIALWLMMQWCMEQGLTAYDMLANPAPYKEEWANERRELAHFIRPLSVGGRAYALWAVHGAPLAHEMYHSLPPGVKAAVRKPLMYLRNAGRQG